MVSRRWASPPTHAITVFSRLASLLVKGRKKGEARTVRVANQAVRAGWVLVHAKDLATPSEHAHYCDSLAPDVPEDSAVYGHILGAVHVSGAVEQAQARAHPTVGPWIGVWPQWPSVLMVDEAVEFARPIKATGFLGLWTAEQRMTSEAFALLRAELHALGDRVDDDAAIARALAAELNGLRRRGAACS
jgi:hypothetical protein